MSKIDKLVEQYGLEDILKIDGHDNAVMGIVDRIGSTTAFVYDTEKIIKNLEKDGMSNEEALEYFEFNIFGAYVGATTPFFFLGVKNKSKSKKTRKKKNRGGKKC